jgi:exopolysaccharide biosynthesis WecB/TagA/CpsF family protein
MRSIRILEVRIDLLDYGALTQMVDTALRGNIPHLFTAPHFYILLLASRQTWLARLLDRSAINYIDGVGTWFASRVLGARKTPRINGTDFHAQMLALALKEKRKVYFLGGDEATCSALEKRIHSSHPEASVAFQHGHIDTADDRIPEAINAFAPELLFIGLGTPKQFAWLDLHFDTLKVPVVLATGAFLDFAAGTRPRAPRWMRRAGLEWLHRLLHDPRRLWRRYILGIPAFLFLLLRERLRGTSRS